MAYISRQCVVCKECTKRCAGKYTGKDENGKPFAEPMYLCENSLCRINMERARGQKQLRILVENRQIRPKR